MVSWALQQKSWSSCVDGKPELFSLKKKKSRMEEKDKVFCVSANGFKLKQKKFRRDIREKNLPIGKDKNYEGNFWEELGGG